MKKIEKLTPEQEKDLVDFRTEYFRLGTSCEPSDRTMAEKMFTRAYATIGKKSPKVIWSESPLSASIMIHILNDDSLRASLRASLSASLRDSLSASLDDSLRASLRASLSASLRASKISPQYTYFWGQQDLYWVSFYKFCQKIGVKYDEKSQEKLDIMDSIGRSCNWWYPFEKIVIACERPLSISLDNQERQHNPTGPSVEFRDGWKVYASHGVRLPEWIIETPEQIMPEKIDSENNAEIRRVMIEKYGLAKYVTDSKFEIVDTGAKNHQVVGLRGARLLTKIQPNDEPIFVIECINSTPELDGTFKKYHIRVDPTQYGGESGKNVLAAMASTWRKANGELFFKNYEDYKPRIET